MSRAVVVVFVVAVLAGVWGLRAAFMARPSPVPEASSLDVVVVADTRVDGDPTASLARAHVDLCVAESSPHVTHSGLDVIEPGSTEGIGVVVGPEERVFRFTTRPGLDRPDRDQLHGCLEDLRVRHLRMEVVRMRLTVEGEVVAERGT